MTHMSLHYSIAQFSFSDFKLTNIIDLIYYVVCKAI